MYTKRDYKNEILRIVQEQGYNPSVIGNLTYKIFMTHQRDIDNVLYEKLLDITNMEMGPEFEMTEEEFKKFLDEI